MLFRARQTDELLEELEREQYVFIIDKGRVSFKSLFSYNVQLFLLFQLLLYPSLHLLAQS